MLIKATCVGWAGSIGFIKYYNIIILKVSKKITNSHLLPVQVDLSENFLQKKLYKMKFCIHMFTFGAMKHLKKYFFESLIFWPHPGKNGAGLVIKLGSNFKIGAFYFSNMLGQID
jgi:hypothetical protein